MITSLVIVPLIAGYVFSFTWKASRYHSMRQEGYVVYFNSAFYGAAMLTMGALVHLILYSQYQEYLRHFEFYVEELFPGLSPKMAASGISISILTLVIGTFLGHILNHIPYISHYLNWYFYQASIKELDMERLLFRSIKRSLPICVVMGDGKVYVGFVIRTIDPVAKMKEIRILPLMSGYRKGDDKRIEFTTYYDEIYDKIAHEKLGRDLNHLEYGDFEKVLPVDKALSINLFDIAAYHEFTSSKILAAT